jgi:transposase
MLKGASKQQLFYTRQQIVKDAQVNGIKPTAVKWSISKNTVRKWLRRYQEKGIKGLEDRRKGPDFIPHKTPLKIEKQVIKYRKQVPCYGPRRLKYFFDLPCSNGAIQRIIKGHGLQRRSRKKYQKKNDLREAKKRYKSLTRLQMDIKYLNDIPNYYGQMNKLNLPRFQYTVRDVKSGMLFLGYSNEISELNARTMITSILEELKEEPKFDLSSLIVQTDNGSEFSGRARKIETNPFVSAIQKYGANHRYIPPGMCNANGDVESIHNTIELEFFDLCKCKSRENFFDQVESYRLFYNFTRPNYSKDCKTPWQITQDDWVKTDIASNISLIKTYDLDRMSSVEQRGHHLPVFAESSFFLEMTR